MKIWIHINGEPQGPFALDDLPIEAMTPDTPVWHGGLRDWTTAKEVAAIMEAMENGKWKMENVECPAEGNGECAEGNGECAEGNGELKIENGEFSEAQVDIEVVEEVVEEGLSEPDPIALSEPEDALSEPEDALSEPEDALSEPEEQPAWPPHNHNEWQPQPPRQQPEQQHAPQDPYQQYPPQDPYGYAPQQPPYGYTQQQPYGYAPQQPPYGYAPQQPYQQPPYGYAPQQPPYQQPYGYAPQQQPRPMQEGGEQPAPKAPSMWLWVSIPLTIIFFGSLFGIAAIILGIISRSKYGAGKYEAAQKLSTACEWVIMVGITCGFVMLPFSMFQ